MADPEKQEGAGPLGRMQGFVAFLSAVVGVVAAIQAVGSKADADRSAQAAEESKHELDRRANDRADRDTNAKYDAIAYEAVVKVLEIDRSKTAGTVAEKRERAVMALVAATASEPMKVALFDVVSTGNNVTPAVKEDATKAANFLREVGSLANDSAAAATSKESTKPVSPNDSPTSLRDYRVVVFYCQAPDQKIVGVQRQAAERLVQEMRAIGASSALQMTWDIKELPEVLNASPGYGIRTNQIRFNPAEGEEAPSVALKSLLEGSNTLKSGNVQLERQIVRKQTPNYLSVFLCGLST
ncbi:MAG TPA: hypothetical protein VFY73_02070 [Ideonella sp.]|uniref:hypothetical protein n=1 Tax=Ideonella sp. TaxID=1929293 RepID=UPI002E353A67|nr:hypothetical protein [Ideonella sp.]HEX5682795.1 hypothetical protein [Ideonella sp.]